jgi:hypothetical protein
MQLNSRRSKVVNAHMLEFHNNDTWILPPIPNELTVEDSLVEAVRENPRQSLSIAFGLGLLAGYILKRKE